MVESRFDGVSFLFSMCLLTMLKLRGFYSSSKRKIRTPMYIAKIYTFFVFIILSVKYVAYNTCESLCLCFQVSKWFLDNSAWGTIVALIAVGNPEVLVLLISQTFGSLDQGSVFNAPFSAKSREKLHFAGAIGNILEDIPQIGLQMVRFYDVIFRADRFQDVREMST